MLTCSLIVSVLLQKPEDSMQRFMMNLQAQSKFFSIPREITQLIYAHLLPNAIHLWQGEGGTQISISPCIQRRDDDHPNCFAQEADNKNTFVSYPSADPINVRRLRSPWGSHWRCEELVTNSLQHHTAEPSCNMTATRSVCRRMSIELAQTMADIVTTHVNDVKTLYVLCKCITSQTQHPSIGISSIILFQNLKQINIALRLPLSDLEALEHAGGTTSSDMSLLYAWQELASAVLHMERLREIHLWIDHNDLCSWSMVHERATLSPLESLWNNQNLRVCVNLPVLHPKWERSDRHFTKDTVPQGLCIERRYRQRCHGVIASNGEISAKYKPDFPVCHSLADLDDTPIEEIEAMERRKWLNGEDPWEELRSLEDLSIVGSWNFVPL